jgi:hypothetical protein
VILLEVLQLLFERKLRYKLAPLSDSRAVDIEDNRNRSQKGSDAAKESTGPIDSQSIELWIRQ